MTSHPQQAGAQPQMLNLMSAGQALKEPKLTNVRRLYLLHFLINYSYDELLAVDCKLLERLQKPEKVEQIRAEIFGATIDPDFEKLSEGQLEKYYLLLSEVDPYTLYQFQQEFELIKATIPDGFIMNIKRVFRSEN